MRKHKKTTKKSKPNNADIINLITVIIELINAVLVLIDLLIRLEL